MADHHHPQQLLWSIDEASSRLGVSRSTLYRLFTARQLTPVHIGTRILVADADIKAFIARKVAEAGDVA